MLKPHGRLQLSMIDLMAGYENDSPLLTPVVGYFLLLKPVVGYFTLISFVADMLIP